MLKANLYIDGAWREDMKIVSITPVVKPELKHFSGSCDWIKNNIVYHVIYIDKYNELLDYEFSVLESIKLV